MKSPLLIIAFNRPNLVDKLLQNLDLSQLISRKMYFSVDGARNKEEQLVVTRVQNLIDGYCKGNNLDYVIWSSKVNKGCKISVSEAISTVLTENESVIILEDDCIPSKSFLPYCDELLSRYKNDTEVMMINGTSFVEMQCGEHTHRFSKCTYVWGWATWARAWKHYDVDMMDYHQLGETVRRKIQDHYQGKAGSLVKLIRDVKPKHIDTWDAQWVYAMWKQKQFFSILPNINLISNIGFGPGSTHTKIKSSLEKRGTHNFDQNLSETFMPANIRQLDQEQYSHITESTSILSILRYWLNSIFK